MGMPSRRKEGEKGAAVLYSGGMDSTVIVADMLQKGYRVFPIAMDDGTLNYNLRRKVAIEASLQQLGILNDLIEVRVPNPEPLRIDRSAFGFVPGYKMLMILAALSHCQILNVTMLIMGYNADNKRGGYRDEGQVFMSKLTDMYHETYSLENNTEHYFGKYISVENPYFNKEKHEMVTLGVSLGVDFSKTISCRQVQVGAGLIHCGECAVCKRRRESFVLADVPDPTQWVTNSLCYDNVMGEQMARLKDTSHYHSGDSVTKYDPQHIVGMLDAAYKHKYPDREW